MVAVFGAGHRSSTNPGLFQARPASALDMRPLAIRPLLHPAKKQIQTPKRPAPSAPGRLHPAKGRSVQCGLPGKSLICYAVSTELLPDGK